MIKLTYGQANALNSPIIQQLFQHPQKTFPFVDGFRLTNMVSQLDGKLIVYKSKVKELVQSLGGKIDPGTGRVQFDTPQETQKFNEKIETLNKETLSIDGDPVTPKNEWPDLSLAEISILSPLLDMGTSNAKKELKVIGKGGGAMRE